MIYLFCGDDAKNKYLAHEKFLKSQNKGVEIFPMSRNNFNRAQVESLYSGASLFSPLAAIFFENILEHEEARDFLLEKLKEMNNSLNSFVFLESKLNKPTLDAFKKAKGEVSIFELPKAKKEKFDNFLLANTFAGKDKLNLWIYFRQAMDRGVGMEELIGVLFWKIKDMILRNNFSKFKEEQLKNFAAKLSYLLPKARKEGRDAESAFEQFLLEAF